MENEEKTYDKNLKLYPFYKAISWDLLFFYTILFLFLTQVKGISAADVLFAEAMYPAFKVLMLIPLTMLMEKIGKRSSLILGNLVNAVSVVFFMISTNLAGIIIAQFFSGIAYDLKGLSETNLLYDSLPKDGKRGSKFSKIDGKGGAWYYYLDGISSVLAGFLYIVNPYIPMVFALSTCFISTYLSYKFIDVQKSKKEDMTSKKYIKDLRFSFKYMFQSNRLKYLIIFGSIFSGLLGTLISLRSGILEEIGVQEQYFGIIFAVLGLLSGLVARVQNRIHNLFHNKTLAIISIPVVISCILAGLIVVLKLPFNITLTIVLMLFGIQYMSKGPFYTLIKRYLNNFTTSSLRAKISSCYNLTESLSRSLISLFASFLLKGTSPAGAVCIIGCIVTIAIVLLLDKMRGKVGLEPEKYEKREIEFLEIK